MGTEVMKFPTVYRISKLSETREGETVKVDDTNFVVGEKAVEGGIPVRDVNTLITSYPILVKEAFRRLGKKEEKVGVSLPVEVLWRDTKKEGKPLTTQLQNLVREKAGVKEVKVLPQGTAGFLWAIKNKQLGRKPTVVIDGGFNTINISLIEPKEQGGFRLVFGVSLMDSGVRKLINQYFSDALREKYPDIPSDEQILNSLFIRGKMRIGGKLINAVEERELAKKSYLSAFLPKVESALASASLSADYEQILVIGGISHYIDKQSIEQTAFAEGCSVYVAEKDGEFYNALGMLAMMGMSGIAVDGGFGHTKVAWISD